MPPSPIRALGRLRHDQRVGARRARPRRLRERTGPRCGSTTGRFEQHGDRYQRRSTGDDGGEDFAYSLDPAGADGPPMLNGDDGFSHKAPDPRHASYYYSRPQLAVSGSVTLAGRTQRGDRQRLARSRVVERTDAGSARKAGTGSASISTTAAR